MTCGCLHKRRKSFESCEGFQISIDSKDAKEKLPFWKKVLIWSSAALFSLILLAFILIWVIIPVSFMLSIAFQTFAIFIPIDSPRNANFDQPETFGISGVFNFYINTTDYHTRGITSIGAWLILHEETINVTDTNNITEIIQNSDRDILMYIHGVFANRAKPTNEYSVFRKHFLIIAVDPRGYGDSGLNVQQTEIGIVNDNIQIYDWVRSINPTSDIYYWGHSLGSGLACHTLRALKTQRSVVPTGVILESPFTTLEDVVIIIARIFKWLAYFNATILKPLDYNGFHFHSSTNILSINSPIMILHAEDDNVVSYFLGERLASIAKENRKLGQGSVIFHGFPFEKGYGHNEITSAPEIPQFITNFREICRNFSSSRKP